MTGRKKTVQIQNENVNMDFVRIKIAKKERLMQSALLFPSSRVNLGEKKGVYKTSW